MSLPREFFRGPQWLAGESRAEWEPVLERARHAWSQIELGSISEGLRSSAVVHLTPAELAIASRDVVRVGLQLTVLESSGAGARVAIHRADRAVPEFAAEWLRAWDASEDARIGELLGFPPCCIAFFEEHWKGAGHSDVVPSMREIDGPWEANILLRWLGVRLVPHLPCSADCAATVTLARAYRDVGAAVKADVDAIEQLLRLPVQYSSLNGLTIVETPHFRFMAGGVAGPVRRSRVGESVRPEPATWEDNGFSSREAMEGAHQVVATAVGPVETAIDLGCGDGALLARLDGTRQAVGIDHDPGRVGRGRKRHPGLFLEEACLEEVLIPRRPFDVALLMPGRLLEISPADASELRRAIPLVAKRLVVYAYGDLLERHGSLAQLSRTAGLGDLGRPVCGDGVEAAEVMR